VFSLQPKVPKQNILRKKEWSQKAMRFKAKLRTKEEQDKAREFVLSVYLADDTVMIFETNRANSGFWGGKFLERSLVAKPKEPDSDEPLEEYYTCEDFYVGAVVVLNTFTLELVDCDAFTRSILDGAPNLDIEGQLLLRQVRSCLKNAGLSNRERFSFCNYSQNGEISQSEMIKALRLLGVALSNGESKRLLFLYDDDNRCAVFGIHLSFHESLLFTLRTLLSSYLSSGTLNFTEFVNMFTDYGKITSSSPARKEQVTLKHRLPYFPSFQLTIAAVSRTKPAHHCVVTLMLLNCIDDLRMRKIIKLSGVIHLSAFECPRDHGCDFCEKSQIIYKTKNPPYCGPKCRANRSET
jgi:hypothetical protein